MSAQHTPGPWMAELKTEGSFSIEADGMGIGGGLLVIARRNQHPLIAEQMHANARLIAAAPELLEACKAMFACCYDLERNDETLAAVKTTMYAIAKATGEMP